MTRSRADAILFDVDDTLVDTRGAFRHALGTVAAKYLPHLGSDQVEELLSHWRADVGGYYRAFTRGEIDYRTQRMTRANVMHELFGGPILNETAYDEWDEIFEASFVAGWQAHDDANEVIESLIDIGYAVGAVTNAPVEYQTRKLAAVGLGHMPVLVGSDTLGYGKPAPEVFLEGCARLGMEPRRTGYIGDEFDIDAVAAKRAGLWGIWLDRPGTRRTPIDPNEIGMSGVTVIHTLTDLRKYMPLEPRDLRWLTDP